MEIFFSNAGIKDRAEEYAKLFVDTFMCDHKGRHTLQKHCASDALMLFFILKLNTQQEDLIHSCVTIKAGIYTTETLCK